ncbi:MAG: serine/threonine protein kinase [Deltaproteobacteria bacterium]|nr:MAG: serine/threonine protein kinase [Deltaproteobacteria bacterium]
MAGREGPATPRGAIAEESEGEMGAIPARWHNGAAVMGRADGTDPALVDTPVPLEGDGHELLGVVIDGRYRLDATLGRGGMGLVYRAAHIGLRRQVAVKILHPSLAMSPEVRNRFEREALAVGKIDHPNCVSVYDVGRLPGGALYLAMELLEGRALADVLEQEGQVAPGRALHILAGILRGLAHIHTAKLIHRDIKPENIFLIRQGDDEDFAKILDFGIAKPMAASDLDDGVKLTQAGMAFGTPIYMAPEQALGNPMDGRADLYAAAVIGYEMLCGQPPFYSDDKLEVMSMHTARPVPPMRQRMIRGARPVPSSIERLVVRGLTKKPADRYATAEDFLAEVESALRTPDGGVTDVVFERRPGRRRDRGRRAKLDRGGDQRRAEHADAGAARRSARCSAAIRAARAARRGAGRGDRRGAARDDRITRRRPRGRRRARPRRRRRRGPRSNRRARDAPRRDRARPAVHRAVRPAGVRAHPRGAAGEREHGVRGGQGRRGRRARAGSAAEDGGAPAAPAVRAVCGDRRVRDRDRRGRRGDHGQPRSRRRGSRARSGDPGGRRRRGAGARRSGARAADPRREQAGDRGRRQRAARARPRPRVAQRERARARRLRARPRARSRSRVRRPAARRAAHDGRQHPGLRRGGAGVRSVGRPHRRSGGPQGRAGQRGARRAAAAQGGAAGDRAPPHDRQR